MTVQELKNLGYKTYISHRRRYFENGPQNGSIKYSPWLKKMEAKGLGYKGDNSGHSNIEVILNGKTIAEAETICGRSDTFSKKRALQILLGRVAKQL